MRKLTPKGLHLIVQTFYFLSILTVSSAFNTAKATPQFARETRFPCAKCHTQVPRLNSFGQKFYANGFRIAGAEKQETVPAYVEANIDMGFASGSSSVPVSFDGVTIGSADWIDKLNLLYKVHYSPFGKTQDVSIDRPFSRGLAVEIGRMFAISQYDPDLQLGLSLPQFLQPLDPMFDNDSVANLNGPFAPANQVDAIRLRFAQGSALPFSQGWHVTATIPFSNDLGDNSPQSFENLSTRPRGVFIEAYERRGMDTYGVNLYEGNDGRNYFGALAQKQFGKFYALAGASQSYAQGSITQAASISLDWNPSFCQAYGLRVDFQSGQTTYVPFCSFYLGGKGSAYSITTELQLQSGAGPAGTVELSFKF